MLQVRDSLSSFLPTLPGIIDTPAHLTNSSLRSLIEKPPVFKEFTLLNHHQVCFYLILEYMCNQNTHRDQILYIMYKFIQLKPDLLCCSGFSLAYSIKLTVWNNENLVSNVMIYTHLLALDSWQPSAFILGPCQNSIGSWTSHQGSADTAVTASTTSTGQVKPPPKMALQMGQTCTRKSTRKRKMMTIKRGKRKRKRRKRRSKNTAQSTLASPAVTPVELVCEGGKGVLIVELL